MNTFGERLESIIKKSGMKKKEVAKIAGVHPNILTGYLKDNIEPGMNKLKKIAFYFGCDLVWLITGYTTQEFITKQQNDEISMRVCQAGPEYRVHDNIEAVDKYLKLTTAHKKLVDNLINDLLKLEGER